MTLRLARDEVLAPAFIDVHCHGAGGGDVLGGSLGTMAETLLRHGVGAVVATVSTAPIDVLMTAARALDRRLQVDDGRRLPGGPAASASSTGFATPAASPGARPVAAILGLHLEGPALAPARSAGHDADRLHLATALSRIAGQRGGRLARVRMVTLAPELDGGLELVGTLRTPGSSPPSATPTPASRSRWRPTWPARARRRTSSTACRRCARASPARSGRRSPRPPSWSSSATAIHVDGALLAPLARAIGDERLLIVSDALPLAGSRLRVVATPGSSARVVGDRAVHPDGTLAGSRLLLDGMVAGQRVTAASRWRARCGP